MVATHGFIDLVSGLACVLIIPTNGHAYPRNGEPKIGISHPECDQLADISVELDAFWCPKCRMNGRVSGHWVHDMVTQSR